MTKVTKIITALLAITLAFTSCSKDEEDEVVAELVNQVEYNETISSLSKVEIERFGTGTWHAGNNSDLILESSNYNNSNRGISIYFELATLSSSYLSTGTYTWFNGSSNSSSTIMPTRRYSNITSITVNGREDLIVSGTLTVSESNNVYTYEFEGETESGKALRFNYSGSTQNTILSRRAPSNK